MDTESEGADMDTSAVLEWYTSERVKRIGREGSPATLESLSARLRCVARIVLTDDLPSLVPKLERRNTVESLLTQLRATLNPNSVRVTVRALSVLDQYARAVGLSDGLALRKGDAPSPRTRGPVTVYDASELDALLAATAHDVRWHLFVLVLIDTGMRIGEVLALQWQHLRLTSTPPFAEVTTSKSGERLVPLSRRIVAALTPEAEAQLRKEQRPNHWRARDYKKDPTVCVFPWSYSNAQQRLRRTCEHAGVPYRGPHHFRHTSATRLLVKGADILPVSRLLGHRSIGITAAYYSHATALDYAHLVRDGV